MSFYGKQFAGIFGGGGGGGSGTPQQEAPSGDVNGVNVTYTLSGTPVADEGVMLWLDGIMQYQGIGLDYTISGATITMTTAPETGQTLWAVYGT